MNKGYLYILIGIVFVLLFILFNNIIKMIKFKKLIYYFHNKSLENEEKRTFYYEKIYREQGSTEKITLKRKLDVYLIRSGLKKRYKNINAETIIFLSILMSIIIVTLSLMITKNILISIPLGTLPFIIIQQIIYVMASRNYEKTDNQIMYFLNMLESNSLSSNDIVTIIDKSIIGLQNPLKENLNQFVSKARTGNVRGAFAELEDNIENEEFRAIIGNLEIASQNDTNYKDILVTSRNMMRVYFDNKQSKKAMKKSGQVQIIINLILGFTMVYLTSKGLIPTLIRDLFNTTVGHIIIGAWVVVLMICLNFFVRLQKN